jgi:hypothetical protein
LRVLSAGRGHFSPDRSNLVTVMIRHLRLLGEMMQAEQSPDRSVRESCRVPCDTPNGDCGD